MQLVISEWGIGGGTQDGNGIAPDVTFLAGRPFFGLWYPYSDGKNPWKKNDFADYRWGCCGRGNGRGYGRGLEWRDLGNPSTVLFKGGVHEYLWCSAAWSVTHASVMDRPAILCAEQEQFAGATRGAAWE